MKKFSLLTVSLLTATLLATPVFAQDNASTTDNTTVTQQQPAQDTADTADSTVTTQQSTQDDTDTDTDTATNPENATLTQESGQKVLPMYLSITHYGVDGVNPAVPLYKEIDTPMELGKTYNFAPKDFPGYKLRDVSVSWGHPFEEKLTPDKATFSRNSDEALKNAIKFFGNPSDVYASVDFVYEKISTPPAPQPQPNPTILAVKRLYNRASNHHFYTSNNQEVSLLQSRGWRLEGTAWKVSSAKQGTPIYRVWNGTTGERIYTRHQSEVNRYVSWGWKNEGIAFYGQQKGQAIYRLRNKQTGKFLLTSGQAEINQLVATGQWRNEGVAFYGLP